MMEPQERRKATIRKAPTMFTKQIAAPTTVSQNELPTQQRYATPPDRRPRTLRNGASNGGNLFGGWGPRLG
jgi:hypothetical protein